MLRCIRCGACMNHCPVYQSVGGHAYGWVYPGPMGAVLTPSLIGIDKSADLPNASTFCGACESVCPVRIPLPKMMRHWRERAFERRLVPVPQRFGLAFWGFFAKRPAALSPGDADRDARSRAFSAARTAASARCRWRKAGPPAAIFRRRKARRFKRNSRRESKGAFEMSARAEILADIRRALGVTGRRRRVAAPSRIG